MHVDVNGISFHVQVSGRDSGPTVVCLHSLATDVHVWDAQLAALESAHRVVRIDLRGHGQSASSPPPYTLAQLGDDVLGVLDALAIERVSVIGVSIGAILAIGLAIEHPDRIARVVIADCRADAPDAYVAMWDTAIAKVESDGLEPVIDDSLARWFSPEFREARPEVVAAVRQRALATSVDGFIGCARAVQGLSYLDRMHAIEAPALFVVGSKDPAAPTAVMQDMADHVANSRFVELDGAGHLTPIEAGEQFTAAVTAFLAGK